MALRHVIASVVLVGFAPGVVHAQGLAQAAKKAQEQSEATAGRGTAVTRLSMSPLDGDLEEIQLTMDLLQQYGQARASIGREFDRDIPMYNRVDDAMRKVSRQREAYRVYEAEPKLKQAIEFNGLSAESFMDLFLTMQRAESRGSNSYGSKPPASMTPLQVANTAFMTQHKSEIIALEDRLKRSRSWQFVWPPMSRVKY